MPLTFQNSVTPARDTDDPVAGSATTFTYNGNTTIAAGAPAPTGGPITGAEAQLAGNAQFPAPIIYCRVGDVVEIRLKNLGVSRSPPRPTTRTASTCTAST